MVHQFVSGSRSNNPAFLRPLVYASLLYAQPIHVSDMINRPGPTLIRHPGQALKKQTERLPVLVPGARGPATVHKLQERDHTTSVLSYW